jgi:hypothetical protein
MLDHLLSAFFLLCSCFRRTHTFQISTVYSLQLPVYQHRYASPSEVQLDQVCIQLEKLHSNNSLMSIRISNDVQLVNELTSTREKAANSVSQDTF